jgi:hypothetical protein
MAPEPNQRQAAPQYQEAEQPPPEYPLDESGQQEAKPPRRRGVFRKVGKVAGGVLEAIVEAAPF